MSQITILEESLDNLDFFSEIFYEPYGQIYFENTLVLHTTSTIDEDDSDDENIEEDNNRNDQFKAHANRIKTDDSEDYYSILGLGDKAWNSTPEDIKQAYRKLVLICHPDKVQNPTEETKKRFLKIQEAFDILSNVEKKQEYDSNYKFDESIPTGKETGDFFDVYEPVLTRNARFSSIQPVPGLGDMNTPYEEVEQFYQFWFGFHSTRTFGNKDEYNPEEAGSRAEKRWMLSMNKANRKKLKSKDNKRLSTLVELAYANDPRVKQHAEEERKKKEEIQKKREQEEMRKQVEEKVKEMKRKQEEEAKRLEAERIKKEQQAEKNRQKKEKKRQIKEIITECGSSISDIDSRFFSDYVTNDELLVIYECYTSKQPLTQKVQECIDKHRQEIRENDERDRQHQEALLNEKEQEKEQAFARAKDTKTGDPWTVKEDYSLIKAIKKFPGGYHNRWETIAKYVNEFGENTIERTPSQCRYRQLELQQQSTETTKCDNSEAWKIYQLKKETFKEKNIVPLQLDKRYSNTNTNVQTVIKSSTEVLKQISQPEITESNEDLPDANGWTQAQQHSLEQAMKKYPSSMDKSERWKQIATEVSGKTKKDCILRVKWIAEQLKAKK